MIARFLLLTCICCASLLCNGQTSKNEYQNGKKFKEETESVRTLYPPLHPENNRKIDIIAGYYLWDYRYVRGDNSEELVFTDFVDNFMICIGQNIIYKGQRVHELVQKEKEYITASNERKTRYETVRSSKYHIEIYKNQALMKDMMMKYYSAWHFMPDTSEFYCDSISYSPRDSDLLPNIFFQAYKNAVASRDTVKLHQWLKCPVIELQLYAMRALHDLTNSGYQLNDDEKRCIALIRKRKGDVLYDTPDGSQNQQLPLDKVLAGLKM